MQLKDVATVKGGKRLPKSDTLVGVKTNHPYIRIRDMYQSYPLEINDKFEYITEDTHQKIKQYIVEEGDVIIAVVGNTIGLVSLIGKSLNGANLTENCDKIVNLHNYDNRFLYYFLKSQEGQDEIRKGIVGSSQPKLPIYNIERFEIPDISIDIQMKIVEIIEGIDKKIKTNEEINKNLEQQAQAIYQQMFIDNARSDSTEGTLSDIADITMGQSPSGSSYNEDGNGTIFFQGRAEFGFRFPTVRLYTTEPKRMACANDTLMSVRAPVGDLNVAHTDCCIGRGLAAIHSKNNHQSFVLYTMFSLKKQLDVFNGEGTVFGSINRNSLNEMPLLIPSSEKLEEFEALIAPMDAAIRNNYDEICRLEQLRDSLLPKLMSGELDVSDIEI